MTMVEKMARAIHASAGHRWEKGGCEHCTRSARAALGAMRALTPGMCDNYRCDTLWRNLNSVKVWRLWIDAALNEHQK